MIVWAGNITTVGGTSASAPNFAAVVALINDALLAKGKPSLGFLNPWIYSEGYKTLTDVKKGSSYGCGTKGFPAQEGWDAVTGWGTPNFKEMVSSPGVTLNDILLKDLRCMLHSRSTVADGTRLVLRSELHVIDDRPMLEMPLNEQK